MGRHAAKHIADGFSLIRDCCGDVNKRLHIGIAGSSRVNYSTAVGVPRQYDRPRLPEKHLLQYSHIIRERGQWGSEQLRH